MLGCWNITYQGLIIYVFCLSSNMGNFSRVTVYLSFVVAFYFGLCIESCLVRKRYYVVCVRDFVIIVFLYLASQNVSYFPFSRSTHQRYNTNSQSSWNFEFFTEYFKDFDYSCNHISLGFLLLSMNFTKDWFTSEIAICIWTTYVAL